MPEFCYVLKVDTAVSGKNPRFSAPSAMWPFAYKKMRNIQHPVREKEKFSEEGTTCFFHLFIFSSWQREMMSQKSDFSRCSPDFAFPGRNVFEYLMRCERNAGRFPVSTVCVHIIMSACSHLHSMAFVSLSPPIHCAWSYAAQHPSC